jgi:hypothetical protein
MIGHPSLIQKESNALHPHVLSHFPPIDPVREHVGCDVGVCRALVGFGVRYIPQPIEMIFHRFVRPLRRNSGKVTVPPWSLNLRPCKLVNITVQVSGTSKSQPQFEEWPRSKDSSKEFELSQYLMCRTNLPRCLIPLMCDGTGLGECRPRSQGDFLEFATKSLSSGCSSGVDISEAVGCTAKSDYLDG